MNGENLLKALRDRLTVSSKVSVADVDLIVWVATTINNGTAIQVSPTSQISSIYVVCTSFDNRKIAAIKALRQMSYDITGQTWNLKESKDSIDEAGTRPVCLFNDIPTEVAERMCSEFNSVESGWIATTDVRTAVKQMVVPGSKW